MKVSVGQPPLPSEFDCHVCDGPCGAGYWNVALQPVGWWFPWRRFVCRSCGPTERTAVRQAAQHLVAEWQRSVDTRPAYATAVLETLALLCELEVGA